MDLSAPAKPGTAPYPASTSTSSKVFHEQTCPIQNPKDHTTSADAPYTRYGVTHGKPGRTVIDIDLQGLLKGDDQISNIFMTDKDVLFIPTAEYFYIIGQVKSPGSYSITRREISLVEAISMAGGFTPIAARNKTRIIRVEKGVEKIIQVQVDAITDAGKKIQDVLIQANDIIVVPESFF